MKTFFMAVELELQDGKVDGLREYLLGAKIKVLHMARRLTHQTQESI